MDDVEANEPLVHCIYSSVSTVEFSKEDIFKLLEVARKNNQKLGVTGMLLYDSGSFFQVLEGHPDIVNPLLEKLKLDGRHNGVVRIIYEEIESRDFAEWTMGYSEVKTEDLDQISGLNNFFKSGSCFQNLDEGRAKSVLEGFKDGRWRTSIS